MAEQGMGALEKKVEHFGEGTVVLARWVVTGLAALGGLAAPDLGENHVFSDLLNRAGINPVSNGIVDVARMIAGGAWLVIGAVVLALTASFSGIADGPVKSEHTKELARWIGFPAGAAFCGRGVRQLFESLIAFHTQGQHYVAKLTNAA